MKKDLFNGKIKQEHIATTLVSIILGAVIFLACAIMFLCVGMFYDKVEESARPLMYVISAICFVFSIAFPITTFVCVRAYPKYKRLADLILKDYVFAEDSDDNETNSSN